MKIHRFIISSYSPIDDLSLKEVTKTSITTYSFLSSVYWQYYEKYGEHSSTSGWSRKSSM